MNKATNILIWTATIALYMLELFAIFMANYSLFPQNIIYAIFEITIATIMAILFKIAAVSLYEYLDEDEEELE